MITTLYMLPEFMNTNFVSDEHEVSACNKCLMTVILWSLKISVQLFLLRGRTISNCFHVQSASLRLRCYG